MTSYEFTGDCSRCGLHYRQPLTKHEAAFFDSLSIDTACPRCGGAPKGSSRSIPDIDLELLHEWWKRGNVVFLSEDEDLIIADASLDVIRAFMGDDRDKMTAMAPILAVKFYDDDFSRSSEREWTANWLVENQPTVTASTENYILKELDRRLGDRLAARQ